MSAPLHSLTRFRNCYAKTTESSLSGIHIDFQLGKGPNWKKLHRFISALSLLAVVGLPLGTYAADNIANDDYALTSSKASSSLLLSLSHAGKRLVAVGDRGHILFSDDNGKTWVQAKVPTRQMLTAVYFINDKKGWAVAHDAQILVSEDAGATWTRQFDDLKREAPLLDVWFQDENHGLTVGAYGAMLETRDGGKHWQDAAERLDNPDQLHLNGIAQVRDAGLFIVGEQGGMFRSTDNGQTWTTVQGPYEGSLFGVVATRQPHTLLVYGLRGNLFRSTDFGDSWKPVKLMASRGPLEFGLAAASLMPDGSIALVGNGGSVLVSQDNGQTFNIFNRPDRLALAGVDAAGDGNLVLVGQGGIHLASATGAELTERQ